MAERLRFNLIIIFLLKMPLYKLIRKMEGLKIAIRIHAIIGLFIKVLLENIFSKKISFVYIMLI